MLFLRVSFAMAMAVLALSCRTAGAETLAAGDWRGGSGGIRGQEWCWLTRSQPDRSEIRLTLHRNGRLSMAMSHPRPLRLPPHQRVTLDVIFDERGVPVPAGAVSAAPGRITVPLAGRLAPGLQTGRSLRIQRGGTVWRFDITGAGAALAALRRCHAALP